MRDMSLVRTAWNRSSAWRTLNHWCFWPLPVGSTLSGCSSQSVILSPWMTWKQLITLYNGSSNDSGVVSNGYTDHARNLPLTEGKTHLNGIISALETAVTVFNYYRRPVMSSISYHLRLVNSFPLHNVRPLEDRKLTDILQHRCHFGLFLTSKPRRRYSAINKRQQVSAFQACFQQVNSSGLHVVLWYDCERFSRERTLWPHIVLTKYALCYLRLHPDQDQQIPAGGCSRCRANHAEHHTSMSHVFQDSARIYGW